VPHGALNAHDAGKRRRRVVLDGFVVALLNPKTALFFAAFLPQFVPPGGGAPLQPLFLATLFVAIAGVTDTLYALFASVAAGRLTNVHSARFVAGGACRLTMRCSERRDT
jgi:threonine/homoserine/homoserine lactone efflux protein